jgi:CRP-like cAMP-binding protein
VGLFGGLPESQLAKIAGFCKEMSFQQGERIFDEGEKAERLYILIEGKVSIRVHLTSRPETVTVAVIEGSYNSFGWSGVVAPYHYTAAAFCETDSRVLVLPGIELMEVLKEDPASGITVMRRVAEIIGSRLKNSRAALLKSL